MSVRKHLNLFLLQYRVMRGHLAVLSLKRDDYLAIRSTNIHDRYIQKTKFRPIYIDMGYGSQILRSLDAFRST